MKGYHRSGEVAERLDRLRDEGFHRVGIGDVEVKPDSLAAVGVDLADDVFELLDAASAECNGKAARGHLDRRRLADSGGGARNDGGAPFGQRPQPLVVRGFVSPGLRKSRDA